MESSHPQFNQIMVNLRYALAEAPEINVYEWQAKRGTPFDQTLEVQDMGFQWQIPDSLWELQLAVQPNLPWAEDHFLERISGIPHNPPPSHEWWPYNQNANAEHRPDGDKFSHTYPERFWPKSAGKDFIDETGMFNHKGIRFKYGDLSDLIQLLVDRPGTRQAYLPIWFPEDLMATRLNERVPCTLGYHFMIRDDELSCRYFMRSCDFFRYFQDDVYMACRLTQYIAGQINEEWFDRDDDRYIKPGKLVMHISSLHIFAPERGKLLDMVEADRQQSLRRGL